MTIDSAGGHGLVWFRRDLRLDDNPAWADATRRHRTVTALFVIDDLLFDRAGTHRRARLLAELRALDASLHERDGRLLVRRGDAAAVVPAEASRLDAMGVYWNSDVTPYATARDDAVRTALGCPVRTHFGHLVLPPGSVTTRQGVTSRVFTAFHKTWRATPWDPWPEADAAAIAAETDLEIPDTGPTLTRAAGETGAETTLRAFAGGPLGDYRAARDRIGETGTSGLSAALHFGTISPRRVIDTLGDGDAERQAFIRQLAWRDWFAHLLFAMPALVSSSLRPGYDHIEWSDDDEDFVAWQEGRTGYPIVDAGMRELAATGTMHNRVRMIAASFLVKDLLVDWRRGERHFRHLLVDGDVAQNVGNWRWVAGTGPDAAPYFRIFNPVTQSRTHDPAARSIRRWVPELAALDDKTIHAPWESGPLDLAAAGVVLGDTYPHPIVDHAWARDRTLGAYRSARGGS